MSERDMMQGYPTDTFCETSWNEEDLRNALELCDKPITEHNLQLLRQLCEEGMIEDMVQAGWEFMHRKLGSYCYNWDE